MLPVALADDHGDEGAERIDRRMRDMENAQQAIDQRQADRHQRIHAAEDQAIEREVDVIHGDVSCVRDHSVGGASSLRSSIQA